MSDQDLAPGKCKCGFYSSPLAQWLGDDGAEGQLGVRQAGLPH